MSPPKILVVDDMFTIRVFLKGLLRPLGLTMLEAGDAKQALALCQKEAPAAVISDVRMQGMTGIELVAALKASPATANIPVVLLTSETDAATREKGLAAGAAAYLHKPIDAEALEKTLSTILGLARAGGLS
jgi:CheY-like chemotaxis protein